MQNEIKGSLLHVVMKYSQRKKIIDDAVNKSSSPPRSRRNLGIIPLSLLSRVCTFYCPKVCDTIRWKGTKSIKAQTRAGPGMRSRR